ncbi:chemotaxis protein [Desulfovibrio psychrotolerans]|uniref:Chemotaxis protein CheV n=1 Tax=Desulfovibrio psychrotolerans TaxID=415242 RepID=A0A7J0BTD0_9BACT|nr:chemotaxis protein [Desulfovibrio psychrotolerans]GFM36969.1 chemotaxis protein CheV [Desulfovibrio psychrotolerans]
MSPEHNILLESGTNELEVLELYIEERLPDGSVVPCYFGVNVAKVMQVIEAPAFNAPESASNPCFMGMIDIRNMMVPVLDLSRWLRMDMVRSEYDVIMVTEFSNAVTGFLVSGVTEIHRVGWQQVQPPSGYISKIGTNCIVGMVDLGDHFVQLVDLENVLADLDPTTFEKAVQEGPRANRTYRALVADDSATIRLMLRKNLEAANFDPLLVNNGQEALNQLRAFRNRMEQEGRPLSDYVDIVISDIEMPLMDGFTLTKNIKEDAVLGRLPVILYSSLITNELRHKGDSVGADDQISKPDLDTMAQRALQLLEAQA